jgi:uncharacterized protein (UPF0332 family)
LKSDSLESSLARKGERAMRSAHMSLREGDPDSAVNRAYYAMFNVARAALLSWECQRVTYRERIGE